MGLWAALAPAVALGDLTLDGSLGTAGPVPLVGDVYEVNQDLGRFSAGNETLFQSFSEFVIEKSRAAEFTSDVFVDQLVIRHTAPQPAEILGEFRSLVMSSPLTGADVFFLSPGGLFIGEDASLSVPASFHMSTAQRLVFESGPDFVATDSSPNPLLSTAPPAAFGFTESAAQIQFSGLEGRGVQGFGVLPGESLSVVGGNVLMFGGPGDNIQAPGATVQLASVADVDPDAQIDVPLALADFDVDAASQDGELGEVFITDDFAINVGTPSGTQVIPAGSVVIRAGQFGFSSSQIRAVHAVDAVDAAPVAIDVGVSDSIIIASGGATQLPNLIQAGTEADGAAGDIVLSGDSVSVRDPGTAVRMEALAGATGALGSVEVIGNEISVTNDAVIETVKSSSGNANAAADAGGSIHLVGGDVLVGAGAQVNSLTSGMTRGGLIHVEGASLEVSGVSPTDDSRFSRIRSDTSGFSGAEGGRVWIESDSVVVGDAGQIQSLGRGSGPGGDLVFDVGSLEVTDAGRIQTEGSFLSPGGGVEIAADRLQVSNSAERSDNAFIATNTRAFSDTVRGGDIEVRARNVELLDGGQIFTQTESPLGADAGDLRILGADSVVASGRDELNRPSGLFTRTLDTATSTEGNGGLLFVDADTVRVENGAHFSASTFGEGNSGNVEIANAKLVEIRGGEDGFSIVTAESIGDVADPGDAGSVSIDSEQLVLGDGGLITTLTSGAGDAGDVEVHSQLISVSGHVPGDPLIPSGIFATSDQAAGGDGGTIRLFTGDLLVFDSGRISVQTFSGQGDAGSIVVEASGAVELASGGEILALSGPVSTGGGGEIGIRAGESVSLAGGSRISSESEGTGDAGDIHIDAGKKFSATDSRVTTQSRNAAGGQIEIVASNEISLLDSAIETDVASGDDGGGNVDLFDPTFVVMNGSHITSTAVGGTGGNITITADYFIESGDSFLDASSEQGVDGQIATGTPEEDLTTNVQPLSASFLDASKLLANACAARGTRSGSFTVGGGETLLAAPDAALTPLDVHGTGAAAQEFETGPCVPL